MPDKRTDFSSAAGVGSAGAAAAAGVGSAGAGAAANRIVRGVNDWSVCESWADRDLQISDEDRRRRARQFMPFAALKGFYDLVEQAEQENEARFRDVFADFDGAAVLEDAGLPSL